MPPLALLVIAALGFLPFGLFGLPLMQTSSDGRAAIMQREGVRLRAYKDVVGVWTIGCGHTGRMSPPPVKAGMVISQALCDQYLAGDLAPVEAAVNAAVRLSKVPVTQNMFDAMSSLAFNIGCPGFTGSTVAHKLELGDKLGAANAFLMWRKPANLLGRRRGERKQFLK